MVALKVVNFATGLLWKAFWLLNAPSRKLSVYKQRPRASRGHEEKCEEAKPTTENFS